MCVRVGDREDRAQHQKIEATLVRHEQSIEETKAAVYNTEAATSSISRKIQRICLALNVDSDAEEEIPPPARRVSILNSLYPGNFIFINTGKVHSKLTFENFCQGAPALANALAEVEARRWSADALEEGSGGRLEGGEDEAQRHWAERDGSFVEGAKEPSPALAPAARRPLRVPALDWKKSSELVVVGRERGTGRKSARGQTSKGRGGERERGGHQDDANGASPRGSESLTPMSSARSECSGTENQTSTRRQVGCVRGAVYKRTRLRILRVCVCVCVYVFLFVHLRACAFPNLGLRM